MTSEIEPAKLLLPFLQRADELQKHEPLVAYYCRLYAMERGLKIPQKERTKTTNALLVSLMKQLEKDKKSLTLGPDDHLHVEGFALSVFSKADKQDRAGRADLNTAKTFYAASIFFDILNQFSEVQPDLEQQKQKYAAWKAADIRKALKEGREPLPGPPGGDDDQSMPSSGEYDLEPSRTDDAIRTDPSRMDHSSTTAPDSDSSPQQYDRANMHHSNISQPSNVTRSSSSNISSPHHYPTDDFPSDNFHEPPPSNSTEHSIHHHQSYQPEVPQHLPQHFPSQNAPSYSYPNFHSYPSFTESSLPTAPSHYPSYHQRSDDSHPNLPPSSAASYPSSAQYNSISRNGNVSDPSSTTAPEYEYDSSYQPPPEQIAEAQTLVSNKHMQRCIRCLPLTIFYLLNPNPSSLSITDKHIYIFTTAIYQMLSFPYYTSTCTHTCIYNIY